MLIPRRENANNPVCYQNTLKMVPEASKSNSKSGFNAHDILNKLTPNEKEELYAFINAHYASIEKMIY